MSKHDLGKPVLPAPPDTIIPQFMANDGLTGLAIEHTHVWRVGRLPRHHRDPFDRVHIAQPQVEALPLLAADPMFEPDDVRS